MKLVVYVAADAEVRQETLTDLSQDEAVSGVDVLADGSITDRVVVEVADEISPADESRVRARVAELVESRVPKVEDVAQRVDALERRLDELESRS